ncbi:hypothetical protein HDV00_004801 [Rhizophlyctis rosea]|nr:hypothetical protein HDV00_004801 [Rhizophlyctis rosea]
MSNHRHPREISGRSDKASTYTADSSEGSEDDDLDRGQSLDIIGWQQQREREKRQEGGGGGGGENDDAHSAKASTVELETRETATRRRKPYIDEYGFYTDQGPVQIVTTQKQRKTLKEQESQWVRVLDNWNAQSKRRGKIKKMCRAGIPESMRAKAWVALAESDKIKEPGRFASLLQQPGKDTTNEEIERDIDRCFPEHFMFTDPKGEGQVIRHLHMWGNRRLIVKISNSRQQNLRKVLRAYAAYKPDPGYCQGMGMLVGMMLMHMQAEEAFWLLVRTLDHYIPDFFNQQLTQLRIDAAVFEFLLHRTNKRLAKHLDKNDVTPLMYITQWFMTIYTTTLPWKTTLRIWDMFYCEGVKPLFRIGLAILKITKDHLLKECPTNAELLTFLLHVPEKYLEADQLVETSLTVKLKGADVEKLRAKVASNPFPERGTVSLIRRKTK